MPPEVEAAFRELQRIARECPEGWGIIATILKEHPEVEPDVVVAFFARSLKKEALPLLRGLSLEEDDELAVAALKALPLLESRAAGDVLVEAYSAHPEGERGRLAWQGVEALQALGINVAVPDPEGARRTVPAYTVREVWEAIPDGVGSREVIVRAQDRYGVWHSLVVVWNDRAGVKDGFLIASSRQEWNELREEQEEEGLSLVATPPDYSRWQIARARQVNEISGFPLEAHLEEWDQVMGPPPEGYTPPDPLDQVRALSPEQRESLTEHLGCLFEHEAFRTWGFEPADCRPWLEEWLLLEETEGLSEEEQAITVQTLLARVVEDVLTPEMPALYKERLLDAARKLSWSRDEHEALIAAAAVLEIEGAREHAQTPFFQMLADNSLAMLSELIEDGEDPEAFRYDPMSPVEDADGEDEEDE